MTNKLEYKGYVGAVDFYPEDNLFFGRVINVSRDILTFRGESVSELKQDFEDAIEDYLAYCSEREEAPEQPFSGELIIHIPAELHKAVVEHVHRENMSLDSWMHHTLTKALA